MNLPSLAQANVSDKRVVVRADLDVSLDNFKEDLRIKSLSKSLDFIKEGGGKIIIIGHRGRPENNDKTLSTSVFKEYFSKWEAQLEENLRFNSGEESNDIEFAKSLASLGDIYVNDAFASSHRLHASIVGVPTLLPHFAGFRFIEEVERLSKVFESPKKPVLFIVSGIKKDKVEMAKALSEKYDKVLVGGRLPEFMGDNTVSVRSLDENEKLVIANLNMDKEDITIHSIDRFKSEISKAGTIILAGVLGKYEDPGHIQGTNEIFKAVSGSAAFKIAGGGDTENVLDSLDLFDKFDWVSTGGGSMLEYLLKESLPGIKALIE